MRHGSLQAIESWSLRTSPTHRLTQNQSPADCKVLKIDEIRMEGLVEHDPPLALQKTLFRFNDPSEGGMMTSCTQQLVRPAKEN